MANRKKFRLAHPHSFVRRLERARRHLNLTQRGMASALGIPAATYEKWLYAKNQPRHVRALETLLAQLLAHKQSSNGPRAATEGSRS